MSHHRHISYHRQYRLRGRHARLKPSLWLASIFVVVLMLAVGGMAALIVIIGLMWVAN